jgi:hypothetical protein
VPELSSVAQTVQIGKETTPGTGVAASKLLNYTSFDLDPQVETVEFRPMGSKVAGTILPGKDYTNLSISGQGSYQELPYLLSSLLTDVTPTTSDTSAKTWLYEPTNRTENTKARYTIEQGSATRAGKVTYGSVNSLEVTFNRENGVTISGSGFAQQYQDNIALTGSPTSVTEAPILPTHLNVYVDTTFAGIGTTKLTRDFNAVWRCNDIAGMVWPINSANASFAADVEIVPTVEMELQASADSAGMGFLTAVRAGSTRYIRLEAISTVLAGAATAFYKVWIDGAMKVKSVGGFDDVDGLKVVNWTLGAVQDTTFSTTAFTRVTVVNTLASL